jgi:hypothetical protein
MLRLLLRIILRSTSKNLFQTVYTTTDLRKATVQAVVELVFEVEAFPPSTIRFPAKVLDSRCRIRAT